MFHLHILSKAVSAVLAILILASQPLLAQTEKDYKGAYEITASLYINGSEPEIVTIPADTRAYGELSGFLHLTGGMGSFSRRWRLECVANFRPETGATWLIKVKDLELNQSRLVNGTLTTEPITLYSVSGKMPKSGTMIIYKTPRERLTLTITPLPQN